MIEKSQFKVAVFSENVFGLMALHLFLILFSMDFRDALLVFLIGQFTFLIRDIYVISSHRSIKD